MRLTFMHEFRMCLRSVLFILCLDSLFLCNLGERAETVHSPFRLHFRSTAISKQIGISRYAGLFRNRFQSAQTSILRGGGEPSAFEAQLQSLMELITAKADKILDPNITLHEKILNSNFTHRAISSRSNKNVAGMLRTTSAELVGLMDSFETRLERLKLWKVRFRRYAKVLYGQALFVCGDTAALGYGDPEKAVRMKHLGDNLWEVAVENIPEEIKFRYLIKNHLSGKADKVQWVTSYPLQLTSQLKDCMLEGGFLVQDNTHQAVRFRVARGGVEQMCVVGSIPELGNWDYDKALKLDNTHGTFWEKVVEIRSDELADFEYKLFSEPDRVVESGPNRISDAHLVEPQREQTGEGGLTDRRIVNLECVWEGLLIRFLIYHPLVNRSSYLAVSGSHEVMGGWLGKPLRMGLGNERTLLTNVQGRCWEATFPAGRCDVRDVQYRYCIVDNGGQSAIFEREPNRRLGVVPGWESAICVDGPTLGVGAAPRGDKSTGFRQREWQTYDGNFVPPNLTFDDVPPCLAIGPYPQTGKDVEQMKAAGITGVLNVQTDGDHQRRMVDWRQMEAHYRRAGIDVIRVPIEDFNGQELARLVKEGARAVDKMVQGARKRGLQPKVYIHCTAGMGRAPAVACVFLVWRHGFSLSDALKHVKKHRPVAAPNWSAMEQALHTGGF